MENNYILINLNQTVSRFQLEEEKIEKNRWIVFCVIISSFIALCIWFITINYSINSLIKEREAVITKINNDIDVLKEKGQVELSKMDIESLYELDKNRTFWADKLLLLSEITPINMAITELEYDKRKFVIGAVTRLDGEKEFDIIRGFIDLLKENKTFSKDFTSIQFLKSERIRSGGKESMIFKVKAKIKSTNKKKKRRK